MKLYAPAYYKKFKCIADKCEHSCCIGWEIDVDAATLDKYKLLDSGYGGEIKNSISEQGSFKLCKGDRCPHLNEMGLCKIILSVGEDFLCDICREHPRFYNFTSVCEVGLGVSCREAARLVLSSDDFSIIEPIGEVDGTSDELDYDARIERARVFEMLNDKACSFHKILEKIRTEFDIPQAKETLFKQRLAEMEYLNEDHRALLSRYSQNNPASGFDEYSRRALAYFVYRHCTEAYDEEDFRIRLAFCLQMESLFASLLASENALNLQKSAEILSIISEEIEYSEENTELLTYF